MYFGDTDYISLVRPTFKGTILHMCGRTLYLYVLLFGTAFYRLHQWDLLWGSFVGPISGFILTYFGGTGGFWLVPFPENADTALIMLALCLSEFLYSILARRASSFTSSSAFFAFLSTQKINIKMSSYWSITAFLQVHMYVLISIDVFLWFLFNFLSSELPVIWNRHYLKHKKKKQTKTVN